MALRNVVTRTPIRLSMTDRIDRKIEVKERGLVVHFRDLLAVAPQM